MHILLFSLAFQRARKLSRKSFFRKGIHAVRPDNRLSSPSFIKGKVWMDGFQEKGDSIIFYLLRIAISWEPTVCSSLIKERVLGPTPSIFFSFQKGEKKNRAWTMDFTF
jgi:hypothetical protein